MAKSRNMNLSGHREKKAVTTLFVRANVFVIEQGFKVEFDDLDKISWHLTVYDREEPIGAARIYKGEDGVWQIGASACWKIIAANIWATRSSAPARTKPRTCKRSSCRSSERAGPCKRLLPQKWLCGIGRRIS